MVECFIMQARTAQILWRMLAVDSSCLYIRTNTHPKSIKLFVEVNFGNVNEFVMIVKMLLDPE